MRIKVLKILKHAGFSPSFLVEGCCSITELLPQSSRSGIYVLHFSDGHYYVGKSVGINRRFAQHKLAFGDILGLSFKSVALSRLNRVERETVELLEGNGARLKNVHLVAVSHAASGFTELMKTADQERWLRDLSFVHCSGKRQRTTERFDIYRRRLQKLRSDPAFAEVRELLRVYVPRAIPSICASEGNFWSLTVLPRGALVRVNLYGHEVLTVYRDEEGVHYSFHLARSPLVPKSLRANFDDRLDITGHRYAAGPADQIQAVLSDTSTAIRFICREDVGIALRRYNLNLMRKGISPWGRYHCFGFATEVLRSG